ncbi:ABC transporter substrate-binding protein [Acanthopleuribacter pedis]|uniref:ABC transporter substrate-binding protein n=1 Tax=Acanthopleuribacter pedis TaxID=442870 RepID=A0A8J7U312_9BACT|nr:ABC transporter substrate-binding protein [Acanthopleuribacter pedis]MBO1317848.1 ABC transporter substrate-binding protein [Acanthopleuribacter pedis]
MTTPAAALLMLLFATPAAPGENNLTPITYAAGYIPNVQFAPFYLAQHRGYYREAGLEVTMDYTIGPEILKMAALRKVTFASADPDAFLHAVQRRMPLVHVATLYQRYPLALIAKEDIFTSEKLRGKRIGITGTYGSSYLGLKAMLAEMGLRLDQVRVVSIGYTQVAALAQDRVDAVVGYANNEPLSLKALGIHTFTRELQKRRFPGVGIMTHPEQVKDGKKHVDAFLNATFRALQDLVKDPKAGYEIVVEHYLPELKAEDRYAAAYAVLEASLPYWQSTYQQKEGWGQCDPKLWENLAEMLAADQKNGNYRKWATHVDRSFTYGK